jgi:hypothetical protein
MFLTAGQMLSALFTLFSLAISLLSFPLSSFLRLLRPVLFLPLHSTPFISARNYNLDARFPSVLVMQEVVEYK